MSKQEYIPYLDWLRWYAALSVLLYHLGIHTDDFYFMSYWWIGVPIFFALSWFLITRILLNSKWAPRYFQDFYTRRAVRIFPLYFLCLGFVALYGYLNEQSIRDVWYYIFFLQNWIFSLDLSNVAFPALFWHSWTLAIEQQFYLIWPLIVWISSRDILKYICIFLIGWSMIARIVLWYTFWWEIAAYATISHIDTLILWSFLAIVFPELKKQKMQYFFYTLLYIVISFGLYLGLCSIYSMPFFWDTHITSTSDAWSTFMILVWAFSLMLIHTLTVFKSKIFDFLFANKLIVHMWKISYGIYLYHVIIINIFDPTIWYMLELRKTIHLFLLNILHPFYETMSLAVEKTFLYTQINIYILLVVSSIWIAHISYTYFEKRFLAIR